MKAKIRHNLTDDELAQVVKALGDKLASKPVNRTGQLSKKIRLPASNPAQVSLSKRVVKLYRDVMINSLVPKIQHVLEKEEQ